MITDSLSELHIEVTSNCQAKCPMCVRTHLDNLVITDLNLDWFVDNIDPSSLEKIMFCGNIGDPCASKELLNICKYLKEKNADLVLGVNTNGALQNATWWQELGKVLSDPRDYVVFSIDGTEETNHIYRKDVSWKNLIRNVKAYVSSGGNAHWDMLVFDHNKHEVDHCESLAKEMGFKFFRRKESSRWRIYPPGSFGLFPATNSWEHIEDCAIQCEAEIDNSRYIDAHGVMWPCCHIANDVMLTDELANISAEETLQNFKDKPYGICKRACGTTSRTGQFKQEIEFIENRI